ncbi:hypothetical protein LTR05_007481 [Lithohypha guttulata]|uniref:Uncharacterized protein n=1 Tax=Lithohypha guttulata TaxID=1690604 RepID=A0AAN7SV42_9EURO|nr:hypothetical protein LTR05_007481 [Lithohypha guttulata]
MKFTNVTGGIYAPQDNISDGGIRVIFKVYFIVLVLLIGLVGNYCCRLNARLRLLRGQIVSLTATTGWVSGPSLIGLIWELRTMPGGWLGFLMLLAAVLDLVGELGAAKTVTSVPWFSTVYHSKGMTMNATTRTAYPSVNWEAYRWASQAQRNSYVNGLDTGLGELHYGIYRMVTNDSHFMANTDDAIGYWSCKRSNNEPIIYDQQWKLNMQKDEVYDTDIWNDLYERSLLYGSGYYTATSNVTSRNPDTGYSTGPSTHTVIMTASNYTYGALYEIKAAIDTKDIDDQGSKEIDTFTCQLRATDTARTVEQIAQVIDIDRTLWAWSPGMIGAMFPGVHEPMSYDLQWLEITLQWYLNSMIMVAGGEESVITPNTVGYKAGAIVNKTFIPWWILVICSIVLLLLCFLTTFAAYLSLACQTAQINHSHARYGRLTVSARGIHDNTPIGMVEWIRYATYESRDEQRRPKSNQLKDYILSTTWHAKRRLGIVQMSKHGQTNPLTHENPFDQRSDTYSDHTTSTSYFPSLREKGAHVVVKQEI